MSEKSATPAQHIQTVLSALEADQWSDAAETAWASLQRSGDWPRMDEAIEASDHFSAQSVKRLRNEHGWKTPQR